MDKLLLPEQLEFLLVTQGFAQLRTGSRRTDAAAKKILKAAADKIGVELSMTKGKNFIRGDVKDG